MLQPEPQRPMAEGGQRPSKGRVGRVVFGPQVVARPRFGIPGDMAVVGAGELDMETRPADEGAHGIRVAVEGVIRDVAPPLARPVGAQRQPDHPTQRSSPGDPREVGDLVGDGVDERPVGTGPDHPDRLGVEREARDRPGGVGRNGSDGEIGPGAVVRRLPGDPARVDPPHPDDRAVPGLPEPRGQPAGQADHPRAGERVPCPGRVVEGSLERPVRAGPPHLHAVTALGHRGETGRRGGLASPGKRVAVPPAVVVARLDRPVRGDPPHLHEVGALGHRGDAPGR